MNGCVYLSGRVSRIAWKGGLLARRFSTENVLPKDMEIIKKPSEKHIKQFQKLVGEFNDIKLLQKTMKDNYRLYLVCKDSTVLSGVHSITYKHLTNSAHDFQVFGLSYQPKNTFNLLPLVMRELVSDLESVSMNSGGCIEAKSAAVWRNVLHTKVRGPTYYVSHYDVDEISNPDLDFSNVIVKDFNDVPSEDVVKYDNSIFPYERKKYLLAKFKNGTGRVAYDKSGKVTGIGLLTVGRSNNCEIGPLYCDNINSAQAIFQSILEDQSLKDLKKIIIRSSDKFEGSVNWFRPFLRRHHEMTPFSHIKFNRGIPDGLNLSKVYVNSNPSNSPC